MDTTPAIRRWRSNATASASPTVREGNSRASWNERPRRARARCSGDSSDISLASITIFPLEGTKPLMASKTVVLPAPLGPMIPRISPCVRPKLTSSTARTPPKVTVSPVTWNTGR